MITFNDGPAEGQRLTLQRAPVYLRIVRDRNTGKWDGLDQLSDTPAPEEDIYVYKIAGEPSSAIVCSRGRRGAGCQRVTLANYSYLETQPSEDILRDNTKWKKWANQQPSV